MITNINTGHGGGLKYFKNITPVKNISVPVLYL